MDLHKIKQLISFFIEINEQEWEEYAALFQRKTVKKKEIILQAGDVCKNVYFVEKGLFRVYFVDKDQNENTFHFAMEQSFVADYESFLRQKPAHYSIQALEDSNLIVMSHEMVHTGYKNLRNGEKLGRRLAEEYFFLFSNKIKSYYTLNPLERYELMNKEFPRILARVPQHYIASYLNISPVHLSRLKNS